MDTKKHPAPPSEASGVGEQSLDPADWQAFRALGHRMLDDMVEYLRTVGDRPAWRPVPAVVRKRLSEPVPRTGADLETVYGQFARDILPYPMGNIHPRFWGWVQGTGTPVGMLAEMLAATMNPLVSGHDQSATIVEQSVIEWLKELLGFPSTASGVLVSGGSMGNLLGLAVGRNAKAGFDVRLHGLQSSSAQRITVYASDQTHAWVTKACELLGLGRDNLRVVPTNSAHEIRLGELREMIAVDRMAECRPACVIGNAGTVNTGATDDLTALAGICRDEGLWFHVDGAFGALAALAPRSRSIVAGIELADSLAFDLHKWGYVQYEAGVVLVRDEKQHRAAFASSSPYLSPASAGVAKEPLYFADLGIQLSRSFRALKIWMSLKTQGADLWGRVIQQNIDQAQYLAHLVSAHPELELLAPVPLNVVCFRYRPLESCDPDLNELNERVLGALHDSGIAVPSSTVLNGRFAIRVANTNHRTRRADMDILVKATTDLGRTLRP